MKKKSSYFSVFLGIATFSLSTTSVFAADFQDLSALDKQIATSLGAAIGTEGGAVSPVDRRLHLTQCPENVVVDKPAAGTVSVHCPSIGWRIRVPLVRTMTHALNHHETSQNGQNTGTSKDNTKGEILVKRGDPVELIAGNSNFTVSVQGTAQQDGALGDHIRVKSDPNKPPVIAVVVESGKVRIPGFE
ncbi:MAG: flagellar basal body P-ring formation chaperone FlgA [Zymomonas mobilis subsp. pomaceae]|uniref:flagellar basal body P-ring formation chaperone FlgA n=1 Tax=Zymomonas mobilis TaxID=542 RepID=UPI0039EACE04